MRWRKQKPRRDPMRSSCSSAGERDVMDAHESHRWCPWFNSLYSTSLTGVEKHRWRETERDRHCVSPQHTAERRRDEMTAIESDGGMDRQGMREGKVWRRRRQWRCTIGICPGLWVATMDYVVVCVCKSMSFFYTRSLWKFNETTT